jgi:ribose/xylose/arabinose/galactoside ABC-type transport system permease subunit/ABC-type sugar transport system substrate-binding protein
LRELAILAMVVLCAAYFGVRNPNFLSADSIQTMLQSAATDGLMVVGMTIVIVSGCFDMSVGSTLAACGMSAALALKAGAPVPLAVLCALIVGAFVGLVNGLLVTRAKINPFITTLGTMSIVRGIVLVTLKDSSLTGFPKGFYDIAWGSIPLGPLAVPLPVVYLIAATIFADVLLRRMRYLRQVYFVGSNEDAADLTGFDVKAIRTFGFVLMGLLAAFAGVIACAKANNLDPNEGIGSELRVIAAVIIGGASLTGGRGTILGSFLGLMLMQIISTGLVFQQVPPEAQQIAVGLVLITAALIDQAGATFGKNLIPLLTQTRNKTMERIVNVALAAVVVLLLLFGFRSGGATATGYGKRNKQTYVMISAATWGPYWIDSKNGLADKARELGVDADFEGPDKMDPDGEIAYIEKAIARKVDGIIVVAMAPSVGKAIDEAIDKGIPVVCADADAPASKRFSFIGTGNYNAGNQGGEILAKEIGYKGDVALVSIPGADNLDQRVAGYKAALAKYPGIRIVAVGNDQGSPPIAQAQCRAILQAHPDLAGFGCVAAIGGQGAAVAVKEAHKAGQIKVVAMDRDEATLDDVDEGLIQATICQRTYAMPYIALQLLYNLRNQDIKLVRDWQKVGVNPLPPTIDTGSFVVTQENVAYFHRKAAEAQTPTK